MAADSYDPAAFDQVGKVGLGDLDISDDGKFLFVMNLYSRKVYRLELNDAYNPTSVIAVTAYAIPNIAVTNGVLRPFAIQFHKDKIYVGAVASGENGGDNTVDGPTDLYAYIFEMTNPTGSATFNASPMLTYPLNYQKGYAIVTINSPANNKWFPWNNNSNVGVTDGAETAYPSPVLSNIEFTDRGDMIMSFFDRSGHQQGYYNYKNLSTTTTLTFQDIGGDVLIASLDCATGSFILENDGTYNSNGVNFSGYTSNNEGPGNGEFFYHEYAPDQYHHETSQGACAIVRGSQGGIYTLMDPAGAFQGGVGRFYSDNGTSSNRTVLYHGADGEFSKANGLGDIEFAGEEPPIELGNRVWYDVDKDGIQDAGENGIPNISINLFCDTDNNGISDGSAIATTLSDADGNWYFNKSNVPDGDCLTTGNQIGLQPNKSYIAKIGTSNWAAGIGVNELSLLQLTSLNAPVVGIADASDNDATIVAATPQIVMSTTKFGFNNHTYDFGFKTLCIEPVFTLTQTAPTCSGATSHNDGKITLSAVTNGTHYGISAGGTYTGPTTIATATAIVGTPDVQTSIPNTGGTYIVRIFNDVDDCYTDQTVTILPVVCTCPTGNCLPIIGAKN